MMEQQYEFVEYNVIFNDRGKESFEGSFPSLQEAYERASDMCDEEPGRTFEDVQILLEENDSQGVSIGYANTKEIIIMKVDLDLF